VLSLTPGVGAMSDNSTSRDDRFPLYFRYVTSRSLLDHLFNDGYMPSLFHPILGSRAYGPRLAQVRAAGQRPDNQAVWKAKASEI
jgi:hypothetical protein